MTAMYTLDACENLIDRYIEAGGEVVTLEDGCLGLGLVMCFGENLKTTIIREVYVNPWQSEHTVRMYNEMPKKYKAMLENTSRWKYQAMLDEL